MIKALSNVTLIVDTREQLPLDLSPYRIERLTLDTGDYSLKGCEHLVTIERKSLDDLLGCVGQSRERFEKEITRLLSFQSRAIVIESDWETLKKGDWRSKIHPQAVIGSLIGWQAKNIPIYLAEDRKFASELVKRHLLIFANRLYRNWANVFSDQNANMNG